MLQTSPGCRARESVPGVYIGVQLTVVIQTRSSAVYGVPEWRWRRTSRNGHSYASPWRHDLRSPGNGVPRKPRRLPRGDPCGVQFSSALEASLRKHTPPAASLQISKLQQGVNISERGHTKSSQHKPLHSSNKLVLTPFEALQHSPSVTSFS